MSSLNRKDGVLSEFDSWMNQRLNFSRCEKFGANGMVTCMPPSVNSQDRLNHNYSKQTLQLVYDVAGRNHGAQLDLKCFAGAVNYDEGSLAASPTLWSIICKLQ